MLKLECAQNMLAKEDVDRNVVCFGIPIQEFDKDDLVTMLAMSMRETEYERKLHQGTMGMLPTCSRPISGLKPTV